ncbi:hypothetical protein ES702_05110 [subsurface metagenome]
MTVRTDPGKLIITSQIPEEELYPRVDSRGEFIAQSGWSNNDLFPIKSSDFILAGMEKKGTYCGARIVSGFNHDSIKYEKFSCRRLTCPVCYKDWLNRTAFRYAVLIESYSRFNKQRPSHVIVSVLPKSAESWTWAEYNNRLHRKGIRELKGIGVVGGVRIFHPYRVARDIKGQLKDLGYADGYDDNPRSWGYWRGVRENALELDHWKDYVVAGPHDHNICFPYWLASHDSPDIVVKKIGNLKTVRHIVGLLRYLLSHAGKLPDSSMPTKRFGIFSGPNRWTPENNLTEDELLAVKKDVAECLNMVYNEQSDDIEYPLEDAPGEEIIFLPIYELPGIIHTEWVNDLSTAELEFWKILAKKVRSREPLLHDVVEEIRPASIKAYHARDFDADESDGLKSSLILENGNPLYFDELLIPGDLGLSLARFYLGQFREAHSRYWLVEKLRAHELEDPYDIIDRLIAAGEIEIRGSDDMLHITRLFQLPIKSRGKKHE